MRKGNGGFSKGKNGSKVAAEKAFHWARDMRAGRSISAKFEFCTALIWAICEQVKTCETNPLASFALQNSVSTVFRATFSGLRYRTQFLRNCYRVCDANSRAKPIEEEQ